MDFDQRLNALSEWLFHFEGSSQRWLWSAIALLAGYVLGTIAARLLRFIARRIAGLAKPASKENQIRTADQVIIEVLGVVVRAVFILVSLAIAANLLISYSLEEARALAVSATKGLAILLGVWLVGSWLGARVRKFGRQVGRVTTTGGETLFSFLAALVRFGFFTIGMVAALQQFGFNTASLLAVVGAAGLAIALALQETLKAVAAGVVIAVFRPFKLGDAVRVAGQDGTVVDITPFTTVLATLDNREIVITNDKVWGDIMVNSSVRSLRRLDLLLSVDYEDDVEEAIGIVTGILTDDHRVRDEPPVWVKVVELTPSSVDLRARAWVSNQDWWEVRCDTLLKVKKAFESAGFSIPYPRQVTVSKGDPDVALAGGAGMKPKDGR